MKMLSRLIGVDDAVKKLVDAFSRTLHLDVEVVKITDAVGRVLAEDIYAPVNRPETSISAVDGYAVRSLDTTSASYYSPVELFIKGTIKPGYGNSGLCVDPGTAVRVHTGAQIPCGADAVVMEEDVQVVGNKVLVYKPVASGSNIVLKGEDFKKGDLLAPRGSLVKPPVIAALSASGVDSIVVYKKINVSIVTIGDELIEPGETPAPGRVYNSSAYVVYSALLRDSLFSVRYAGIVPDSVEEVENAVLGEFEKGVDLVITTGGTGISESDVIVDFVARNGEFVFRGVKMRPGRPTSSSIIHSKLVVHLSGFPVAAWCGYELILRRALIEWLGIRGLERHYVYARLARRLPGSPGYCSVVRVMLYEDNGELYADPYMLRGSGVISSLLRTNGYIIIPENVEGYEKGSRVRVYLYD